MAVVNNGVRVRIASGMIPSGATLPNVTTFDDYEYKREERLSIAKAIVEDANKATTFDNILNDATVGIEKQVTDIITADYIGSNDVQLFADLVFLGNNISPGTNSDFYSDAPVAYIARVDIYVKTV